MLKCGLLQWRHNEHDGVSNHQPHDCLLNRLFRRRWKKISKLRVTGLCAGNSPVNSEFPAQRASNAENVSIWWRHHDDGRGRPDSGGLRHDHHFNSVSLRNIGLGGRVPENISSSLYITEGPITSLNKNVNAKSCWLNFSCRGATPTNMPMQGSFKCRWNPIVIWHGMLSNIFMTCSVENDSTYDVAMTNVWYRLDVEPLQWRHNEHDGISNHQLTIFTQAFFHLHIKENIKAPCHWPLLREFTGDRWIPRTKGQ